MSDKGLVVQGALYAALSTALDVPVYDHVPPGTATPYVTIGDIISLEDGTKTEDGQEHTATVHVWTEAHRGTKAARELMAEVYDALHRQTLSGVLWCVHEYAEVMADPDGLTYHGVTRFRIITQG